MNQDNFEYTKASNFEENKMEDIKPICEPICECPQERVCHRYMCYHVPHIIPCNTRIINHHIYKHTYTPCYTCCEENVVSNVYDRKC